MKVRLSILALLPAAIIAIGGSVAHGPLPPPSSGPATLPPVFLRSATPWADSVFATLGTEERIAQLMMVAAYSNKDAKHEEEVRRLVRDRGIGGLIFFQGGPVRQARLTERYQAVAKVPLLLGMDLEWGLSMRLDSTLRFPRQMALGAIQDEGLIEAMGFEIARQMKHLGVHVSFSPVLDVNNDPRNPVINDRSFGEDRENVARKGIAYMHGLQRGGVLATAKHFPGHGDVDSDSHHTLPYIGHGRERLDSLELYPFRRLAREGLGAVMVAHLEVPALDDTKGLPSTLSAPIVQGLLLNEIGFQGLVFTDALNMKGVANAEKPGEIELRALKAGNDVMLFPQDPVKAIERIKKAVAEGELDSARIAHSCLKVLRAKEWAGLAKRPPIIVQGLTDSLTTPEGKALCRTLYGKAITVASDHQELLPIRGVDTLRIASLVIGDKTDNTFQQALRRHAPVEVFRCEKALRPEETRALLDKLSGFDRVIVSVHGTTWRVNKEFGVPTTALDIVREVAARKPVIFTLFANPYALGRAYGAVLKATTIVAYEETEDSMEMAAQVIFGASGANGRLPVSASAFYAAGDGRTIGPIGRLGHAPPEAVGIRTDALARIDAIVEEGIAGQAYPGAQVLVAVDGRIIVDRTYGHHRYDGVRPVRHDDLYDLASITKVASTTLALMKLVDEGQVDLSKRLGHYLPELEGRHPAHARMGLRDILTHQAGLKAWVPFQNRLMKDGEFKPGVAGDSATESHPVRVMEGLYLRKAYADSMLQWVLGTPLGKAGEYVYSDMGYYLLQELIERRTGTPLDRYVSETFYGPMGAVTLGYMPWRRFPLDRIAPTEHDKLFRKRLVHGDVHDPGAAMRGGVAGHAGLFGSATDLAKVMWMLLQGGTYGGHRYLSEEVVREFTKCQFCKPDGSGNRRALGFDRRTLNGSGPTCDCVSYASFGHTGFTGTMAWADPESGLIYVFLSNRVHPSAEKNRLAQLNIRTRVQEVVHAAVAERAVREARAMGKGW